MREILFRGKRIDNDEWTYGSFIPDMLEVYQNGSGVWIGDRGFIKPFGKTKEERLMVEVERKTVGQYTGMADRNGKKIFEGDIVKTNTDICVIVWQRSRFIAKKPNKRPMTLQYIKFSGEVIGNIYDNPELLKGV